MTTTIPRPLLATIVDEVFDGAIEDPSVIEDIYRVIVREQAKPLDETADQLDKVAQSLDKAPLDKPLAATAVDYKGAISRASVHELKTDSDAFQAVWMREKTHEIRYNDRDFKVGDILILQETKYSGQEMCGPEPKPLEYTGAWSRREVSHIQEGYGLAPGWVILSFRPDNGKVNDSEPSPFATQPVQAMAEISDHDVIQTCEAHGYPLDPSQIEVVTAVVNQMRRGVIVPVPAESARPEAKGNSFERSIRGISALLENMTDDCVARLNVGNADAMVAAAFIPMVRQLVDRAFAESAAPEPIHASDAPFTNCEFRECDLPGQCKGEGRCHHPAGGRPAPAVDAVPAADKGETL